MKPSKIRTLIALAVAFAFSLLFAAPDSKPRLTSKDIEQMMTSLSNWGRWGPQDQLGAVNLITPQIRKQAAALVKDGLSVSLAHDATKVKIGGSPAFEHKMLLTGQRENAGASMDAYSVAYHGYTQTHLDALCHLFYKGKMYNGFSQKEVSDTGAARLSVIGFKNGIFTRGVLMDMPRLWGVKYLEGARAIYPEDLEAWEKKAGIKVEAGDAIFIRTGRWARQAAEGDWEFEKNSAGLDASCLPWLKKRDVAILASDLASDVMPSGIDGFRLPVHLVAIAAMGVPIFDNCDLEAVSEAAASRKRWEFLLTAAPLAVEGGTGSPINPMATF